MEHLLLWLLRTLLMLILALAFAVPMLRTTGFGAFLGRSQRDIALVIDTSYSMDYSTGRRTVWDQAVETAVEVIEGLTEQDRFCIYLADESATPLIEQLSGDREEAVGYLKALKPGYTSSQLLPAVMAANDALDQEQRRREREIHIITDGQALPWRRFGRGTDEGAAAGEAAAGHWDPAAIAERTVCFVTRLGVPAPENVAPVHVRVAPDVLMADTPSKVQARLTHDGPPRDVTVTLYVDDEEIGRRSVMVGGADPGDLVFAVPELGIGLHAARLETPPDNLPGDNRFYFFIRAREKLPTLCVGSRADTLFLTAALTVGASAGGIGAERVAPGELGETDLDRFACVFLCNALPLAGQEILRLERYVRGGGLLVIGPGDRAALDDYAAWRSLPGMPSAVADVGVRDRKQVLRWEQPRHPLLRMLEVGGSEPVIPVRRHLVWNAFEKDAGVLVAAGAETPFVVSRPFGRGMVLMLAVPFDRTWSDFPLSPFYLPLVHQMVRLGAGVGGAAPFLWTAESLAIRDHLPQATVGSVIMDPQGREIPVRSAVVEGETVLHAEDVNVPGIYTLSTAEHPEPVPALAVNMPRSESDLAPIDSADIPDILGLPHLNVADSPETLRRQVEDHRMGHTFGEALLWLALVLAVVEFCYANYLLRSTPTLTESLRVESSGRVTGASPGGGGGRA